MHSAVDQLLLLLSLLLGGILSCPLGGVVHTVV